MDLKFSRITPFFPVALILMGFVLLYVYLFNMDHSTKEFKNVTITTSSGSYLVNAEEVRSADGKARGLMYRDSLDSDDGMLFYFLSDTSQGFWMKNCKIPLDIIFISSESKVVDIKKGFQPCSSDPCPVYKPPMPYRYVLEVNGGWSNDHSLGPGDSVLFDR